MTEKKSGKRTLQEIQDQNIIEQNMREQEIAENGRTVSFEEDRPLLPVIAIVGRPNVGKSSLFNAILRKRLAIVHFDSGVTRDRVVSTGVRDGRRFNLIDTGGLGMFSGEKKKVDFWDSSIEAQVETAVESADTVFFVVDVTAGLTELDKSIAARLRSSGKKIIVVVNKADNMSTAECAAEFSTLGFKKLFAVSCLHRSGIDALMSEALKGVQANADDFANEVEPLRIAVLGRPNVGKSSLVNRMLGEKRVIVSDVAGTTRDAVDVDFTLDCKGEKVPAVLVDTAGLRKRSKISEAVEHYSIMRAEQALESCDIVLFLIEAPNGGSTSQDKTIARMITESGKGCIIVANKIDLCQGKKPADFQKELHETFPRMKYAPLLLVSAKNGYNLDELYALIADLRATMSMKVTTSMLNRVITDAQEKNAPPLVGGHSFKIYYGTMLGNTPPTFSLFVNNPKYLTENYRLYIENYMRNAFEFKGFPLQVLMKARRREALSDLLARGPGKEGEEKEKKSASGKTKKVSPFIKKGVAGKGRRAGHKPSEGPVRSGKGRALAAGRRTHRAKRK